MTARSISREQPRSIDLILGGAQIGQPYGPQRSVSLNDPRLVQALLDTAWNEGFNAVDTARGYGQSEAHLAEASWAGEIHTKLDSKFAPIESFRTSQALLKRDFIDVLYLCHDARNLSKVSERQWKEVVRQLKDHVGKFGLSLYQDQVAESFHDFDFVGVLQVPLNIVQIPYPQEVLDKWRSGRLTVYARSIFAQGHLLDGGKYLVNRDFHSALERVRDLGRELELSTGELSLRWMLNQDTFQGLVIGISQVREISKISTWVRKGPLSQEALEHVDREMSLVRRTFDMRGLR